MHNFQDIATKVKAGERLDESEGLYLYEEAPLLDLGQLADWKSRSIHESQVFFNVNRHINPTNVCAKSCKFCAFSRKPGEDGAYELTIDQMIEKASDVVAQGATEVHMVGGLHPRWRFSHYTDILSSLKKAHPELHIKAFTAVEIDWLAAKGRMSIEDTLKALHEAGLDSMPGGGAEIFHPEIRSQICDTKTDAERWIMIHRTAHAIGLRSNCTMLYGHIEQAKHRVDHMRRLRELQDETEGFNVFIPLAFQPQDNDMGINRYTPGILDLRTLAVARLFMDNFRHIKAYWIMLGQDVAQLGLNFGANDLDGTVTEEKISRMAGGRSGMSMDKDHIQAIIKKAQRVPVERDTLYNPLSVVEATEPADSSKLHNILYRSEKGEALTEDQAAYLVRNASLFQLGHCAQLSKKRLHNKSQAGLALSLPQLPKQALHDDDELVNCIRSLTSSRFMTSSGHVILPIDLCSMALDEPVQASRLVQLIGAAKKLNPNVGISILGLKQLWASARASGLALQDFIAQLSSAGLDLIESSIHETEDDLTTSEVIDFHRACHRADINTVGKLELGAPYSGPAEPFWEALIQRALAFKKLHDETRGIHALKIESAKGSFITPHEYLRAVSLSRILADNIDHILAPFRKIPTIKAKPESAVAINSDPAMKVAPLTFHFGASDLGALPVDAGDPLTLLEELQISGIHAEFRDTNFEHVSI